MILRRRMSLRVQLTLLVVAALVAALLLSLFLFADERSLAIRAALGFEAAGRAANVARLIAEAPPDLHASILRAANSPLPKASEKGRERPRNPVLRSAGGSSASTARRRTPPPSV